MPCVSHFCATRKMPCVVLGSRPSGGRGWGSSAPGERSLTRRPPMGWKAAAGSGGGRPCPGAREVRGAPIWGPGRLTPGTLGRRHMLRAQGGSVGRPCTQRPQGGLWKKTKPKHNLLLNSVYYYYYFFLQ